MVHGQRFTAILYENELAKAVNGYLEVSFILHRNLIDLVGREVAGRALTFTSISPSNKRLPQTAHSTSLSFVLTKLASELSPRPYNGHDRGFAS